MKKPVFIGQAFFVPVAAGLIQLFITLHDDSSKLFYFWLTLTDD